MVVDYAHPRNEWNLFESERKLTLRTIFHNGVGSELSATYEVAYVGTNALVNMI